MKTILLIASAAALAPTAAAAEPVTKTVTVDRPNYNATRVIVRDKDAGTYTRDTAVVRERDGATASRDYSRTHTGSGSTTTGSATGRKGQSYNLSGNRARTDAGFTANQNAVNDDGQIVYNRDASVSRSGGNVTRTTNVTRTSGFHPPRVAGRGFRGGHRP